MSPNVGRKTWIRIWKQESNLEIELEINRIPTVDRKSLLPRRTVAKTPKRSPIVGPLCRRTNVED